MIKIDPNLEPKILTILLILNLVSLVMLVHYDIKNFYFWLLMGIGYGIFMYRLFKNN